LGGGVEGPETTGGRLGKTHDAEGKRKAGKKASQQEYGVEALRGRTTDDGAGEKSANLQ